MLASAFSSTFMLYTGARIVTNTESPAVVVLRYVYLLFYFTVYPTINFTISNSGSMEPAFQRGDILFLTNPPAEKYINGDIVVYKVPGAHIPIVHRVIEARDVERWSSDDNEIDMEIEDMDPDLPSRNRTNRRTIWNKTAGDQLLLTKGDNNPIDDIGLYNGLDRLRRGHIIGKVRGYACVFLCNLLSLLLTELVCSFIPYIGYISIVLAGRFSIPADYCIDITTERHACRAQVVGLLLLIEGE
jgi:signal peptidase